jgi:predicted RNA binding protein YcfA (HicA-like mRNA interferase family)
MSRLPRIDGKTIITALGKLGFRVSRIKGSHHFLRHADGRVTVVPVHVGETIGPGLFTKIINDCDLTREEFERLL